jgi:hypothetical protein
MKKLRFFILLFTIPAHSYGQSDSYKYKVDFFGDTILVDGNDKTIGIKKKDFFGNTIIADKNGNKIATQKKDFFGKTILENESGKTIGKQSTDFFGNSVVIPENGKFLVEKYGGVLPGNGTKEVVTKQKTDVLFMRF